MKLFLKILIVLLAIFISSSASAPTVHWETAINYNREISKRVWIDEHIIKESFIQSDKRGIDPLLTISIISVESEGKWYARSKVGAIGLMQVMPFHYPQDPKKLYEWKFNIHKGTDYLKACINKFYPHYIKAVSCYNMGEFNKHINLRYVEKVKLRHQYLRELLYSGRLVDEVIGYRRKTQGTWL